MCSLGHTLCRDHSGTQRIHSCLRLSWQQKLSPCKCSQSWGLSLPPSFPVLCSLQMNLKALVYASDPGSITVQDCCWLLTWRTRVQSCPHFWCDEFYQFPSTAWDHSTFPYLPQHISSSTGEVSFHLLCGIWGLTARTPSSQLTFITNIECSSCVTPCSKLFTCIVSFNLHNS